MNQQVAVMLDTHSDTSVFASDFSDDRYDDLFDENEALAGCNNFDVEIDAWTRLAISVHGIGDI